MTSSFQHTHTHTPPQRVVIIGGGIIGASILYYMAKHPYRPPGSSVTLLEASYELAASASGRSGGFLARDWHGFSTSSLARLSYQLHKDLAEEGNGVERWGYREVETLQVNIDTSKHRSKCPKELNWIDPKLVTSTKHMGGKGSTAQVTPKYLVEYLVEEACKEPGVECHVGTKATEILLSEEDTIKGLVIESVDGQRAETLDCDRVVVAAGPWTGELFKSLIQPTSLLYHSKVARKGRTVGGSRAHSIILRGTRPTTAHCLFTDMRFGDTGIVARGPEIYARGDGTVYICGGSDNEPLPALADDIGYEPRQTKKLMEQIRIIAPTCLGDGALLEAQHACYLPAGAFRGPLIDGLPEIGLYIAAGHTCWGITLGPGTGKVMAELIYEGKAHSAEIGGLRA